MNIRALVSIVPISVFSTSLYLLAAEVPSKPDIKKLAQEPTPLHLAAWQGQTEIIRALLAAGANIETQDEDQRTPLHMAARNGHIEAIKELIGAHANIEGKSLNLNTDQLLHYILLLIMDIQKQSKHLLKLMLILKLKIIINGLHYIWLLIMDMQKQLRALLEAHANIEAQDKDQHTPLHCGCLLRTYRSNQSTSCSPCKY